MDPMGLLDPVDHCDVPFLQLMFVWKDGGGPGDGWAWYDRSYIDASAWPIGLQVGGNTDREFWKRQREGIIRSLDFTQFFFWGGIKQAANVWWISRISH